MEHFVFDRHVRVKQVKYFVLLYFKLTFEEEVTGNDAGIRLVMARARFEIVKKAGNRRAPIKDKMLTCTCFNEGRGTNVDGDFVRFSLTTEIDPPKIGGLSEPLETGKELAENDVFPLLLIEKLLML